MKIRLLVVLVVSVCSIHAVHAENNGKLGTEYFTCPNRLVRVILPTARVEALKNKFLVINSLPYDLKSAPVGKERSEVLISYRTLRPGDEFSTPKNPGFFKLVGDILSGGEKDLQIEKMSAEYLPGNRC